MYLEAVPLFTPLQHNEVRRFVTLVDELYEHGTELHMQAAGPPRQLFSGIMHDIADDDGASVAALRHSVDASYLSSTAESSALRDLRFASARAVSRLTEICGLNLPVDQAK